MRVIKRADIQKRLEFNELLGRIRSLDAIRSRASLSHPLSCPLSHAPLSFILRLFSSSLREYARVARALVTRLIWWHARDQ